MASPADDASGCYVANFSSQVQGVPPQPRGGREVQSDSSRVSVVSSKERRDGALPFCVSSQGDRARKEGSPSYNEQKFHCVFHTYGRCVSNRFGHVAEVAVVVPGGFD